MRRSKIRPDFSLPLTIFGCQNLVPVACISTISSSYTFSFFLSPSCADQSALSANAELCRPLPAAAVIAHTMPQAASFRRAGSPLTPALPWPSHYTAMQ